MIPVLSTSAVVLTTADAGPNLLVRVVAALVVVGVMAAVVVAVRRWRA